MCFSAPASFTSAAILATSGVVAIALNKNSRQGWFVLLPLIFSLQQAAEGVVWMTIHSSTQASSLHQIAIIVFIAIAFVVWPVWIPWSIFKMESHKKRKIGLWICQFMGLFFASIAIYVITMGNSRAEIQGHCLNYSFENNAATFFPPNLHAVFYFSSTVIPFFISSQAWVKTIGILIFIGLLLTQAAWKQATTSVWCFFAAIASFYICIHLIKSSAPSQSQPDTYPLGKM